MCGPVEIYFGPNDLGDRGVWVVYQALGVGGSICSRICLLATWCWPFSWHLSALPGTADWRSVVIPGVIGASVGMNLLELLVAFIQAYVFAFLTALFIGAAIHPH